MFAENEDGSESYDKVQPGDLSVVDAVMRR
jgi:hypothetical protein